MMKHAISIVLCAAALTAGASGQTMRTVSADDLRDRIAGGWAGKMIGVSYGAPTEFRAQAKTYEDALAWEPGRVKNSIGQDDIYVQLSFMMTMDAHGIDAPAAKFAESFATAGYPLWHANAQARKNFFDGIMPPLSGSPEYNSHADDIDFQIEADYIGFMCPGMPVTAVKIADKVGHIMNYGDGVYGGMFVAALYTHAFFETDIARIVDQALLSIPEKASMPNASAMSCSFTPIPGRLARGLAADRGEMGPRRHLRGARALQYRRQDERRVYCHGTPLRRRGFRENNGDFPPLRAGFGLQSLQCRRGHRGHEGHARHTRRVEERHTGHRRLEFIFTGYTFNTAVDNTLKYARRLAVENGGKSGGGSVTFKLQPPVAPKLEQSFPNVVPDRIVEYSDPSWSFTGDWSAPGTNLRKSESPRAEADFTFTGTGSRSTGNGRPRVARRMSTWTINSAAPSIHGSNRAGDMSSGRHSA